ncbi:pre-mRNA-splicing factor syf2 [Phtheirospermum japonicum]|uniref:Pre-mRNA-splicing factor SYF2 n=1 Tax=Phtheirospermum japonicum TaxID=374723 RepID=A0A830CAB4_9LAMI|nr:pre-mRNA-splicing factor syf2 [Phtheirospermum japonicum]
MVEERRVHPDCRNSSNPCHECSEYCFKIIAETKKKMSKTDTGPKDVDDNVEPDEIAAAHDQREGANVESNGRDNHSDEEEIGSVGEDDDDDDAAKSIVNLTGRQKKLFELRLKMNEARKANHTAMVAEKKKTEVPVEPRGISKQKWLEERKKKIGRLLDANGLDMSKAYMMDTQEMAESKYKKWEKEPAPAGWDVFNQKTLYNAYKKRTKNMNIDLEEYNKMKEADQEFYREASSLQYGKAPKISEDNINRMVKELKEREEKSRVFSRRRKFREEKDIDSINDRNEHFNKKIERAFGKYTLEIKNNLERGTALPD